MFVLLAGALLLQSPSALVPDAVLEPPGLPPIVVLRTPTPGLTALRYTMPYDADQADRARIAMEIARTRLTDGAGFIDALVRVDLTPSNIGLTVSGADEDLDFLGFMLRRSVEPPTTAELGAAIETVMTAAEAANETGLAYLHAAAHPRCEGVRAPVEPTTPHLDGPEHVTLPRGAPMLVVSTGLPHEALLAAVAGLPAIAPDLGAPVTSGRPAVTPPRTLRTWFGTWWTNTEPGTPAMKVLATLVEQALATPADSHTQTGSTLLKARCAESLLVWEAKYPERFDGRSGSTARVNSAPSDQVLDRMSTGITEAGLKATVRQIDLEARRAASTPDGLVDLVGTMMERTGRTRDALDWLEELTTLDVAVVRAAIESLLASGSRRAAP